jgi:syntaxin 5
MSWKDRTLEFAQIVDTMRQQKKMTKRPLLAHADGMASSVPRSQFAVAASQLGRQIHDTAQKLANLTKLAKNTSLFDDKTIEIHQLTHVIKQDITTLNTQIEALQNYVKTQKALRKNKQTETHALGVVGSLKSELANTTKRFQKVLETRTENLKIQQEKRQQFTGGSLALTKGKSVLHEASKPPRAFPNGVHSTNGVHGDVTIHLPDDPSGGGMMMGMQQQQQQKQTLLTVQDSYIRSRTQAVENIGQTIIELQGIFTQLATIVAEQGEMMQRIDANISDSQANIDNAQAQLLKYLHSISGNRWLIAKIFLVLLVFIVLFVVFFM